MLIDAGIGTRNWSTPGQIRLAQAWLAAAG
jgi:hypothetical protein